MKCYQNFIERLLSGNKKTKTPEKLLLYDDDIGRAVSIIDARENRTKRVLLKTVASFVSFVFLWQQIASAWGYPQVTTAASKYAAEETAPQQFSAIKSMIKEKRAADLSPEDQNGENTETLEVTNFDLLSYKRRTSGVVDLLSTPRDREQSSAYAPNYLKRQQNKHEEIIRQKQDTEDLIMRLRKRPNEPVDDMPLKKKKSGGGGDVDYTLTDPDQFTDPHTLNDFTQADNQDMTVKFDITKIDIERWMQGAEEKIDEKTGVKYWVGTGDVNVGDDRKIQIIMYFGEGDDKKIQTIFVGYRMTASGEYEAKYRIDYKYGDNGSLTETIKTDISGDEEKVVERSIYEGTGDASHITKTIYYADDGSIKQRRDYKYSGSGALEETLLFESDSEEENDGTLLQRAVFSGDKDKEIMDYSQTFTNGSVDGDGNISGEVVSTTVYYYFGGKRADQVTGDEFRYSKTKQITFRGDPDANGDGTITDEEIAGADIKSITYFDSEGRLAGEEVVDYMVSCGDDGSVKRTTVYFYADGSRAAGANYRDCLTKTVTYSGDLDVDGDGKISDQELADGVKISETFYDTEFRLKGEEKSDYTVRYNSKGEKTSLIVYEYDSDAGLVRASDAETDAAMRKSTTYAASSIAEDEYNADGTLKDGEDGLIDDPLKVSETFYRGDVGEEKADYMVKYNSRGEKTSITVYQYEGAAGLVSADESDPESAMKKSTTYTADSIAEDEYNEDGTLKDGEDGLVEDPIKVSETFYQGNVGEEKADYTIKYNSKGEKVSITVLMYEGTDGLVGADEADAEAAMKKSTTYTAGSIAEDEFNEDGTLKDGEDGLIDDPIKISETFYEGSAGEEKADYTVKYNSSGEKTSLTVFEYESQNGLVRAGDATAADPMKKSTMYSSNSIAEDEFNEDGTLKDGEDGLVDDPIKISETFYEGGVGEEKADYVLKYDSRGDKTSITVYEYEGVSGLVRAGEATSEDAMKKSTTYSASSIAEDEYNEDGTLKDGEDGLIDDPIKISETFYEGSVGEEKADFSVKFNSKGERTSITVFEYESQDGLVRAGDATAVDPMKKSTTYTASSIAGDEFNEDGTLKDGEDGLIDDPIKVSETFYEGSVGEEKADYTIKYNSNGDKISITVYMYEGADGLVGAGEAMAEDAMRKSITYTADSIAEDEYNEDGTLKDGEDGLIDDPVIDTVTFFEGSVGEEKADYSLKKGPDGSFLSLTVYKYMGMTGLVGAAEASVEDALKKTISYGYSSIASDEFNVDDSLMDGADGITDTAYIESETYYAGTSGEEKTDYAIKYNSSSEIVTITVYEYQGTSGLVRAEQAVPEDALAVTTTYTADSVAAGEYDVDGVLLTGEDGLIASPAKMSETLYYGAAGEEIANYSKSYRLSDGMVKSISVFYYGTDSRRADDPAAVYTDELVMTESYMTADIGSISKVEGSANLLSSTVYTGVKGREIARYSHNFKMGSSSDVKSTSIFFYEGKTADELTAVEAVTSAMTRSESFQGAVTDVDETKITGVTYYYGDKGDEIADYSQSTKLGARSDVKSTSIFFYNDKRANTLTGAEIASAAMTKSESF
ncbi:MAG: hypothetical protein PHY34_06470, partial [Patescibacteria group bacterium]|nr:hypothetical protein [Patescibacteria group bacterium]